MSGYMFIRVIVYKKLYHSKDEGSYSDNISSPFNYTFCQFLVPNSQFLMSTAFMFYRQALFIFNPFSLARSEKVQ